MKKLSLFTVSLLVAAASFGQTTISHNVNALRAGDVRQLKQVEYLPQGNSGANQIWDFSNSKEIRSFYINQAEKEVVSNSKNLQLACDENGEKSSLFEISATQKMQWGLETSHVKIAFNAPVVDLKFPFSYGEKIEGVMDGSYTENGISNPINGAYITQADAWGTLIAPDGNVYKNVLRVKIEKIYTQKFYSSISNSDEEYQIKSIRYQYFEKGVRYPIVTVLENDIKTDCNCACSSKSNEMYYEAPSVVFEEEIIPPKSSKLTSFEYSVAPNPFKNDLQIWFYLEDDAQVDMKILDVNGKTVKNIVNNKALNAGAQSFEEDMSFTISGQYILRLVVNGEVYATKLIKR